MLELFGYMIYDDICSIRVCPMGDITQNCYLHSESLTSSLVQWTMPYQWRSISWENHRSRGLFQLAMFDFFGGVPLF